MLEDLTEFISNVKDAVWDNKLITSLTLVGALAAGTASYLNETKRDSNIPLAFSEKHQIHIDAERKGEQVSPFTEHNTSVNDAGMKIIEAWNLSHGSSFNKLERFARELEVKIDPSLNYHHYSLDALLKNIPQESIAAMKSFGPFIVAANGMLPVNNNFSRTWDESHIDTTHTEYYECGDSEHPRTCSKEVYDYTTHDYDYNKNEGEAAAKGLSDVLIKCKGLQFTEKLGVPSRTNAEGEYAAEKTNKTSKDKGRFSPERLFKIATTWNSGSTLNQNLPAIMAAWNALQNDSEAWNSAKNTAHDERYKTYSHFDSGPREYQISEKALSDGKKFVNSIGEIVSGLECSRQYAPILNRTIEQFIEVTLNHKVKYSDLSKNPDKLASEIMDYARKIYFANIKGGADISGFRGSVVFAWILLGSLVGAGTGVGIKRILRRNDYV